MTNTIEICNLTLESGNSNGKIKEKPSINSTIEALNTVIDYVTNEKFSINEINIVKKIMC